MRAFWPGGAPLSVAFPIIKAAGTALSYAHRHGVIHSDFKPSNILVGPSTVKVLDFGIARAVRPQDGATLAGEKTGLTPAYASCEMLEGLPADERDDLFCFGLVVYFVLSGSHSFNGMAATDARDLEVPVAPLQGLSRRQNVLLFRALRFDRAARTTRIDELVEVLQCEAAAQGMARVATAYKQEAWCLYAAGQYSKAAAMATVALSIWKDSREMHRLQEEIARRSPGAISSP